MSKKLIIGSTALVAGLIFFNSCATIPKGATPVKDFEAIRYLGTWYEIARFDYKFEKNLDNVTAQYSQNDNGTIKVLNGGYNYKKKTWKSSEGVAKFRNSESEGALKVSFFKPFYAAYNVVAIDEEYRYALVIGKNLKYIWLLSREKTMPDSYKNQYLELAQKIGFNTSKLIWVKHDRDNPVLNND